MVSKVFSGLDILLTGSRYQLAKVFSLDHAEVRRRRPSDLQLTVTHLLCFIVYLIELSPPNGRSKVIYWVMRGSNIPVSAREDNNYASTLQCVHHVYADTLPTQTNAHLYQSQSVSRPATSSPTGPSNYPTASPGVLPSLSKAWWRSRLQLEWNVSHTHLDGSCSSVGMMKHSKSWSSSIETEWKGKRQNYWRGKMRTVPTQHSGRPSEIVPLDGRPSWLSS